MSEETIKAIEPITNDNGSKEKDKLTGPFGIDIGTTHIVIAIKNDKNEKHVETTKQLNAFFTVPYSKFTGKILTQNEVMFYNQNGSFYVIGNSAETFANNLGLDLRRPMQGGFLNPKEEEGINIIQAIIKKLVKLPKKYGEKICFSIPGPILDSHNSVIFHESVLKKTFESMGFNPTSINEAMAIIIAELEKDNYTGIAISMGGGMCNVCFSYLSIPVVEFSIQKGGDYIDNLVANNLGEHPMTIKMIKENDLDLTREPKNRIETALQIFYDDLFSTLLNNIRRVLSTSDKMPRIAKPMPLILGGGTVMPKGCKDRFDQLLKTVQMPVQISSVRIAESPLNVTAKGALIKAMSEEQ
ncbi:magnetosome protein Mad28-1 [Candidatus Magnetoovum chiemensis]|nr:magnetosome protein Mad28-1 [Candidatus Magnetoovum chiemensis]